MLEKWTEMEGIAKAAWDDALSEATEAKSALDKATERERAARMRAHYMANLHESTARMVRLLKGEETP
jgi:hypothetical protein